MALCDEVLRGAIDLHQHAAPSLFDRIADDIGLASEARPRGMRMFVQMLLERGFSPEEPRTMIVSNPARLLGLD